MNTLKRIASAALSFAMLAGVAAGNLSAQMTASAAAPRVRYTTVMNQWQTRINAEKQKFPDGKFWNHKNGAPDSEDSYSNTPCDHAPDKVMHQLACNKVDLEYIMWNDRTSTQTQSDDVGQCYGFAHKLAKDLWDTDRFVRYYVDSSYEPRVGDNVRLTFTASNGVKVGHSIFITAISGEQIYFAECNGDMEDCRIGWDENQYYTTFRTQVRNYPDQYNQSHPVTLYIGYNATNVTKSYLRRYASTYERPYLKGDFNLNGKIDSADVTLFRTTYLANGNTASGISNSEYDVNGDLQLTEDDYSQIQYYAGLNYVDGVIDKQDHTVTYCDRNSVPSGAFIYDNGIYSKINGSTATFLGLFKLNTTSKNVLSYVYEGSTRYKVTAIGQPGMTRPAGTKSRIDTLTNIGIPDTVTTINKYAFSSGQSDLTRVTFTGSNPGLTTIGDGAFYFCSKLTSLDLARCKSLTTIGASAFSGCTRLSSVYLPNTTHSIYIGGSNGSSVFGNNKTNVTTFRLMEGTSQYQKLALSANDIQYWSTGKLRLYGKLFSVCRWDNGSYLGRRDKTAGYLYAP